MVELLMEVSPWVLGTEVRSGNIKLETDLLTLTRPGLRGGSFSPSLLEILGTSPGLGRDDLELVTLGARPTEIFLLVLSQSWKHLVSLSSGPNSLSYSA